MPRTKEASDELRRKTRQRIELGALSLFARKGLSVKVGEIAEAAGVSQGLLYSYYPSKDALVIELVRQATTMSSKSISSISEGDAPAAEVVKTISRMMCQMFAEAPMGIDYFMFMLQVGMSGFDVPQASGYSAQTPNPIETLAEIITRGQAEGSVVAGDPSQLSGLYWATIQGLCCCIIAGAPVTPEPRALSRILLKEEFL